jgi:hypothetical protein
MQPVSRWKFHAPGISHAKMRAIDKKKAARKPPFLFRVEQAQGLLVCVLITTPVTVAIKAATPTTVSVLPMASDPRETQLAVTVREQVGSAVR